MESRLAAKNLAVKGKWRVILNGYRVSIWGDENILKLITAYSYEYAKKTELYSLNG